MKSTPNAVDRPLVALQGVLVFKPELIDTTEFGFAVLLASVQEAASRGMD